jgi:hypothetical protein
MRSFTQKSIIFTSLLVALLVGFYLAVTFWFIPKHVAKDKQDEASSDAGFILTAATTLCGLVVYLGNYLDSK